MAYQLSPEDSPFTRLPVIGAYYVAVASLLVPDNSRGSSLGVVCLPSFENEWSLLVEIECSGDFTATLRKADDQIWACFQDTAPSVSTSKATLPEVLGRKALRIWSDQLKNVGYQSPPVDGLDGVTYHLFANHDQCRLAGTTWSPNPESDVGHLVEIAHTIHEFVEAQPSDRSGIIDQFHQHATWFTQSPRQRDHEEPMQRLQRDVRKVLAHLDAGIFTPREVANYISRQLAYDGYPPLGPLLEIVNTLPQTVLALLRASEKEA